MFLSLATLTDEISDSSEKELKAKEAILGICVQRIENAKSFAQSLVGFACKNSLDSCLFPFFKQASDIYEEKFTCLSDLLKELPIISGSLTYKDLMNGLKGARILSELKAIVDSDGVFHMVCDDQDAAVLAANQMKPIVLLSHSNRRTSNVGAMMGEFLKIKSTSNVLILVPSHGTGLSQHYPPTWLIKVCTAVFGTRGPEKASPTSCYGTQVYSRCKGQGLKMCVEQMAHIKIDASCSDLAKKAVEKAVVSSMHPWQNLKIDQLRKKLK
uniref:Uncharacterized protein n=1 Tax=Romanomermis culicivorax TaxID=13658 RepID=A0A915L8N2_ROMCU